MSAQAAIVTGGGRSIGAAIAARLAEDGYDVAVLDLDGGSAAQTAESIAVATGARTLGVTADVRDAAAVEAAFERVVAWSGSLAVLVNNAAIPHGVPLSRLDEARWDRAIDTNLKGTFLCIRAAATHMKAAGGAIVNISSVASHGYFGHFEYSASKGGVDALTVSAALELAPFGIRVNCVAPGPVRREGPMTESLRPYVDQTPLGRLSTPRDIANVVAFLCSDASAMVVGQRIQVCGGRNVGFGFRPTPGIEVAR